MSYEQRTDGDPADVDRSLRLRTSAFGMFSLLIGIVVVGELALAMAFVNTTDNTTGEGIVTFLAIAFGLVMSLPGLILGVVGANGRYRSKGSAVMGLLLNGGALLVIIGGALFLFKQVE